MTTPTPHLARELPPETRDYLALLAEQAVRKRAERRNTR
jgi:hypothetical protein